MTQHDVFTLFKQLMLTLLDQSLAQKVLKLVSTWLELNDWSVFDDAIQQAFWDSGQTLPGDTPVEQAAYALKHAQHIMVFLGSGFSVDSGIASFRTKNNDQEAIYSGLEPWQMTHRETFTEHAKEQLQWHQRWREVMEEAKPHAGQLALVQLLAGDVLSPKSKVTFVTQNVDMLLEKSLEHTSRSAKELHIVHLHGTMERARCHTCNKVATSLSNPLPPLDQLPHCQFCGGPLRPDVVWFGEKLADEEWNKAKMSAASAEVCLIVGTSALVHPAAELPTIAKESGARLIEINTHESLATPYCDVHIEDTAKHALVSIFEHIQTEKS